MKKIKMSVNDCLFELAKIDSQQKRMARGDDLEFNKKVKEESKKIIAEFYKSFNEVSFMDSLKNAFDNK